MSDIQQLLNDINILYERKKNIKALFDLLNNKTEVDIISIIKPQIINNTKIPPGIINYGNTCFHNSAIQLLYRIEELRDFIINQNIINQYNNVEIKKIIELFAIMKSHSKDSISFDYINENELILNHTCYILPEIQKYYKKYNNRNYRQQDVEEFINIILVKLNLDCAIPMNDWNFIYNKDKLCNDKINRFNFNKKDPRTFLNITLIENIYSTNKQTYMIVNDNNDILIDHDTNIDYLSDNEIKILHSEKELCGTNLERKNILILDINDNDTRDINNIIKFNFNSIEINLKNISSYEGKLRFTEYNILCNKYIMMQLKCFEYIHGESTKKYHTIPLASDNGNIKIAQHTKEFELVGFIVHIGTTPNSGHYVVYVKYDDIWYLYNDTIISKIDTKPIWNDVYKPEKKNELQELIKNVLAINNSSQQYNNIDIEIQKLHDKYKKNKNELLSKNMDLLNKKKQLDKLNEELKKNINNLDEKKKVLIESAFTDYENTYDNQARKSYNNLIDEIDEINRHSPYILLYRKKNPNTFEYMDPTVDFLKSLIPVNII